jgi:hypothetical protein
MHACSLKFTLHMSVELESLNDLPGYSFKWNIDRSMWNNYDKPSIKTPRDLDESSRYHSVGFQAFIGLSRMLLCSISLPSWYHTFSMATLHFADIIESSKIDEALNNLSFGGKLVNSKYQTTKNCKFYLSALVWTGPKWYVFPTKPVSTYLSQDGLTLPLQKGPVLGQVNCQG